MLTPADHNDAAFASSPRFSQNVPSNSCRFFSRATFCVSLSRNNSQKVARAFVEGLTVAVCYTAKWLKSSSTNMGECREEKWKGPGRPTHEVVDTWLSQRCREISSVAFFWISGNRRGARLGRIRWGTPVGARERPALPEAEGEAHGQKASAGRTHRRLTGDTSAMLVARAGRVRADTSACTVRHLRYRTCRADGSLAAHPPAPDSTLRRGGYGGSLPDGGGQEAKASAQHPRVHRRP